MGLLNQQGLRMFYMNKSAVLATQLSNPGVILHQEKWLINFTTSKFWMNVGKLGVLMIAVN